LAWIRLLLLLLLLLPETFGEMQKREVGGGRLLGLFRRKKIGQSVASTSPIWKE
jgi:hypothetical protein